MTTRITALCLSLALLCALSACTAASASRPESGISSFTTAASSPTDTKASDTKAPETPTTTELEFFPEVLFPTAKEYRIAYETCQKMSYTEYFSAPRYLFSEFRDHRMVEPLKSDPTKIVDLDNDTVYFDARKYKKVAKQAFGGYQGDAIVDFFRVDDEIWRWYIPTDTVDVVVKDHDRLYGVKGICSDVVLCYVDNDDITEEFPFDDRPGHFHILSKNLTIPYEDMPYLQPAEMYQWLMKNIYSK